MKPVLFSFLMLSLAVAGCAQESATSESAPPVQAAAPGELAAVPALNVDMVDADTTTPAASEEKAGAETVTALSPQNTKIEFVGTHVGDKPDPRKGSFGEFSGQAALNGSTLKSLRVEIDTASLSTEIEKLTNHLKSPDFFDVREHPKAEFESTSIEIDGEGNVSITGNLTLLGETKSIRFPATVSAEEGLTIKASFTIDRTQFGMDYGVANVEKEVEVTVAVGD